MSISFRDRTFCASPECINACGRKMTEEEKQECKNFQNTGFTLPVSYGYFCGEPKQQEGIEHD